MQIVYRVDNFLGNCPLWAATVGPDSLGSCSPTVWMLGCLLPPGGLGRWWDTETLLLLITGLLVE